MTKADFVMRAMYGDQKEIVVTMERRAALAIEACEAWEQGGRLMDEEAVQLFCAFYSHSHARHYLHSPDQKRWLAVARKAREIHGKEGV